MPHAPRFLCLATLIAFCFSCCFLHAQDASTGAVRGLVLDPDSRPVPNATVALVSADTGTLRSTSSDAGGRFALDLLSPGEYSARAEIKGMSPQVYPQVRVEVGSNVELEFHLSLAGARENVTVSGAPPLVETVPSSFPPWSTRRRLPIFP